MAYSGIHQLMMQAGAQHYAAGIDDLYLLVPGKEIKAEAAWPRLFPYAPEVQFDGMNSDQTALTIGRTLAAITGQRLTRTLS
jgi:hypothetical protein